MSNVNADATQLLTILKNMRTSISSIETTRSSVKMKYQPKNTLLHLPKVYKNMIMLIWTLLLHEILSSRVCKHLMLVIRLISIALAC